MTNQSTAPQPKPDDEPQKSVAIPESKEELEKLLVAVYQEFAGPIPPPFYDETV